MPQHESDIGVHMSPPSWTSLLPPTPSHPSRLSQGAWFELPTSCSKFPQATCFTHGNARVSMLLSQLIPPAVPHWVRSLFSLSVGPSLPCYRLMSLSELREMGMDREAWRAAVRGVTKSRTRLHQTEVPQYHLSRFRIYLLMYDICFSLTYFILFSF